ncbi:MAG: GNAT family N-acetyltransferase [Acidobacteriota bacterium]
MDSNTPRPTIVAYRPEYRESFMRLNLDWLEGNGLLEPIDLEYLRDPETHILAGGGQVFVALLADEVVGTSAAIRVSPTTFELAKLAVRPSARRLGLGRQLTKVVIDFARNAGATEVVLTSNSILAAAIRLYESLGFRHAPMPAGIRYVTANVYMVLELTARR